MPYDAVVYKVMIASPSDVAAERHAIREILLNWNDVHAEDRQQILMPVSWETHSSPSMGERPQAIINKQVLRDCDLLIAVFWTRIGSPTGEAVSGTVEEIEEHVAAGKPAMLYFSSAPVAPDSIDASQYTALQKFKKDCYNRGLVECYDSLAEFRDKLTRHLAQTIIRHFPSTSSDATDPGLPPPPAVPSLSQPARELLIAAASTDGTVIRLRLLSGRRVEAGGRLFNKEGEARSEARWEGALEELVHLGLIQDRGFKGEIYRITELGYQLYDRIKGTE